MTESTAKKRFRKAITAEQESSLLRSTVPRNTENNTKWAVKIFEDWQSQREEKSPKCFYTSSAALDVTKIHDLTTPLKDMNGETLNLWLTRFVEEVSNSRGERYPSRSLYLIICGIRRYLREENDLDPLSKDDRRLVLMSWGIVFVVLLINRK